LNLSVTTNGSTIPAGDANGGGTCVAGVNGGAGMLPGVAGGACGIWLLSVRLSIPKNDGGAAPPSASCMATKEVTNSSRSWLTL